MRALLAVLISTAILLLPSRAAGIEAVDASADAASSPGLTNYDGAASDSVVDGGPLPSRALPPDVASSGDEDDDDDDDDDDDGDEYYHDDNDDGDDDEEEDQDDYDSDDEEGVDGEEDYEIRIRLALAHYQARSRGLMHGLLPRGGGTTIGGGGEAAVVGTDGEVEVVDADPATTRGGGDVDVDEELRRVQFEMAALEREWERVEMLNRPRVPRVAPPDGGGGDDDGDGDDYGDSEDDGDDDGADVDVGAREKRLFLEGDPEFKALHDGITDPKYRDEIYWDVKEEANRKARMDIDRWHALSYWELHAYFECARAFAFPRPLYTSEMWTELRALWRDFREKDAMSPPIKSGEPERTYVYGEGSFDPPMEPFQSGEKGRGLRAKRDISKGEMVFKATNNTVVFNRGHTWRLFLFHIYERHGEDGPYDSGTTCDVLVWSWVQALEEDGDPVIVADFDNGSLLNEGRDSEGWDKPNVRCGREGDALCMMEYYATRDIETGDEILCDYREFALLDSWEDMGL